MKSSIRATPGQVGRFGEKLAEQALEAKGYKVLDRNWRSKSGEIDLIASDAEFIVFVEVKARRSSRFGAPEEALVSSKQRRMTATVLDYLLHTSQQDRPWRADLVAIDLSPENKVIRLTHYIGIELE